MITLIKAGSESEVIKTIGSLVEQNPKLDTQGTFALLQSSIRDDSTSLKIEAIKVTSILDKN